MVPNHIPPLDDDVLLTWAPPSALWLKLPSGQVLIYQGHQPSGVFVAISGTLRAMGAGTPEVTLHAPCVVPAPGDIHHPCARTVVLATDLHALFVPRSVVLADAAVREKLESCYRRWGAPLSGRPEPEKT